MSVDRAPPQEGKLGFLAQAAGQAFALQVCHSRAGFYIGTRDDEGLPFSRESAEYWGTEGEAAAGTAPAAPAADAKAADAKAGDKKDEKKDDKKK